MPHTYFLLISLYLLSAISLSPTSTMPAEQQSKVSSSHRTSLNIYRNEQRLPSAEITSETTTETLILASTFTGSGNTAWSATGMGTYYTDGYGVKSSSAGATLQAINVDGLRQMPVGSSIRIEVAAVTNHATNTAPISIYGLDQNGEQINEQAVNVTTHSSTFTTISQFKTIAQNNIRSISIPISLKEKIVGIKIVIGSSLSRTLVDTISIYTTPGDTLTQADAFAGLVNDGIGARAQANCTNVLKQIDDEYNLLSLDAQTLLESEEPLYQQAQSRVAYLRQFVESVSANNLINEQAINQNKISQMIILFALLSFSSVIYYSITSHHKISTHR